VVGGARATVVSVPSSEQQLHEDHLRAWASALNLRLYDNDPGPREMIVGGPGEERVIDRRERLVDSYAKLLLVQVDGDLDRLLAVAAQYSRSSCEPQSSHL
jgi:hypothetical protein